MASRAARQRNAVIVPGCAALLIGSVLLGGACSSSGRRDQYYGTDAGKSYRPPEAGAADRAGGGGPGGEADGGRADATGTDATRPDAGDRG